MPHPVTVFLGYCFETCKLNGHGQFDEFGRSNREIGDWVHEEILRLSGGRINVRVTQNPLESPISEKVKQEIAASDAAVFVFPKRVQCQLSKLWTTSQYVISESGWADARFRHRARDRVFAFIEEGVAREHLGLAFPGDRTVPSFNRDRLSELVPQLDGTPTKS
jgi:hypothetical protein